MSNVFADNNNSNKKIDKYLRIYKQHQSKAKSTLVIKTETKHKYYPEN